MATATSGLILYVDVIAPAKPAPDSSCTFATAYTSHECFIVDKCRRASASVTTAERSSNALPATSLLLSESSLRAIVIKSPGRTRSRTSDTVGGRQHLHSYG